jgi:hypothetical protein
MNYFRVSINRAQLQRLKFEDNVRETCSCAMPRPPAVEILDRSYQ